MSEDVAVIGAIASIAAVIIALITLNAVLKQLRVANSQLGIADAQLRLARDEVNYVKEDLELNRQQLREIVRRPDLKLLFGNRATESTYFSDVFGGGVQPFDVPMRIANEGRRATTDWQVVVFLPMAFFLRYKHELKREVIEHIADEDYVRHAIASVSKRIYPRDGYSFNARMPLALENSSSSFPIYYRIYDDYGAYPADEEFGKLTLRTAPVDPRHTKGFH